MALIFVLVVAFRSIWLALVWMLIKVQRNVAKTMSSKQRTNGKIQLQINLLLQVFCCKCLRNSGQIFIQTFKILPMLLMTSLDSKPVPLLLTTN